MLDAISTGLKLITVKEAQFFVSSATHTIILVTLFNVLAIHSISVSWKRGRSLEILLASCFLVTWIMLEITGVTQVTTLLATAGR